MLKYLLPNVLYEKFCDRVISTLEKYVWFHYFPYIHIQFGYIYFWKEYSNDLYQIIMFSI